MKKILVVEDSSTVLKVIKHVMTLLSPFEGLYAKSFAEAKRIIKNEQDNIFAGLIDLNLPDAPSGEVVDYTLSLNIPTIVLTGSFDEVKRTELLNKGVVDYVTKEGRFSYSYAIELISRLQKNQKVKVLVADDSKVSRQYITQLLKLYQLQVFEAEDGYDAIKVLIQHPDITLLITDFNMPKMNGFELTQTLRNKYEKTDLIIIGLSSADHPSLSAKFIKNGANDFLRKPFNQEEFQCRVLHNIETLEMVEQIRKVANQDYLTGAYTRRYFFETAQPIYEKALSDNSPISIAVLDIDFFKQINDNYGHDAGDDVLKIFSAQVNESLGRFLVARAGGEEFFVLMAGLNNQQACALIDKLRQVISSSPIEVPDNDIYITFSAGVCSSLHQTIDEQIALADQYLYRAKEAGRNLVIGDD